MTTFAQWEKQIRLIDDTVTIFTTLDENGAVIDAFTSRGERWQLVNSKADMAIYTIFGVKVFTDQSKWGEPNA